ncbi:MAG: hypothetical protein SVM80_02260 [Halobacteriota archaeon]|nr:hypothetical protein [Halobacteriota archaeon]
MTEIWRVELNDKDNYRIRYNRGDGHFEDFVDVFPDHMLKLLESLKEKEEEIEKQIEEGKGGD